MEEVKKKKKGKKARLRSKMANMRSDVYGPIRAQGGAGPHVGRPGL